MIRIDNSKKIFLQEYIFDRCWEKGYDISIESIFWDYWHKKSVSGSYLFDRTGQEIYKYAKETH